MDSTFSAEGAIRSNRPRTFPDVGPDWVFPQYQGFGLANLPATIASVLGAELPGACPSLHEKLSRTWADGVENVVLILFDGLGYRQLQRAVNSDPGLFLSTLIERHGVHPITSVFPSTTSAALMTLWSGYAPAAHGNLAYAVFLREFSTPASLLHFTPISSFSRDALSGWGLEPKTFVPVPGLAQQLAAQGIRTRVVTDGALADSIFSKVLYRGVETIDRTTGVADLWFGLARALFGARDERKFVFVYCPFLDAVTHKRGPGDRTWVLELDAHCRMLKIVLSGLSAEHKRNTLLLITGDHGAVPSSPGDAVSFQDHAALLNGLLFPPLGEDRVALLHVRHDSFATVEDYIKGTLANDFVTLNRQRILDSGLLGPGPIRPETASRLGDLNGTSWPRTLIRGK